MFGHFVISASVRIEVCNFFRTPFWSRPRLKVKVLKSTLGFQWQLHFLSEHFCPHWSEPSESVKDSTRSRRKCEESDFYALGGGVANQDASNQQSKLNRCTQKWLKMVRRVEEQELSKSWQLPIMVKCGWGQYDHPPPRMVKDEFPKEIKTNGLGGREAFA